LIVGTCAFGRALSDICNVDSAIGVTAPAFLRVFCSGQRVTFTLAISDTVLVGHVGTIAIAGTWKSSATARLSEATKISSGSIGNSRRVNN
jgi:hypothetical protein